ncbi:MAG: PKD domain-containing protein [Methanogenium sp.]|nr:PKD domain-containing protein [Methanogenium sp.]
MENKRLTKNTGFWLLFIVSLLSVLVVPVLADTQPVASFSAVPTSGTAPLSVVFSDSSTGGNLTYSWDFGGSEGTSGSQSPAHTYETAGTYTVTLEVSNAEGADTASAIIEVSESVASPTADFTANVTSGTAPLTVSFTDLSSGDPTGWSWDFGVGEGTSTDQNPLHTYSDAGTYTVTLTASNEGGSTTATETITVSSGVLPPIADFTANVTIGTPPLTVKFSDRSTGSPTSWSWDFEESSGGAQENAVHTFDYVGNYNISLTVSKDPGGADTKIIENYIRVGYAPTADFTAVPRSGDNPLTVNFTDTSTHDPTSWEWDFGDGRSSILQSPNHVYMYRGRYNVTLTATNEFGSDEEIKTEYIQIDLSAATSTPTPTPTVTTRAPTATPTQTVVPVALAATAVADETYAVAGRGDNPVRAEIQKLHSFYLEYIKLIKEILRI